MEKTEQQKSEAEDYFFSDEDIDWELEDYEAELNRPHARRGIDDYFERKEMESLDDWFDELD